MGISSNEFMELFSHREEKLDRLREEARSHWERACEFDGIDPGESDPFIVFSEDNPHAASYGTSIAEWGRLKNSNFIEVV